MPACTRLNEAEKGSEKHDAGISNPPAQYEESDSDWELMLNSVMSACGLPLGYNFSKSTGQEVVDKNQDQEDLSEAKGHHAESNSESDSRPSAVASGSSAECRPGRSRFYRWW